MTFSLTMTWVHLEKPNRVAQQTLHAAAQKGTVQQTPSARQAAVAVKLIVETVDLKQYGQQMYRCTHFRSDGMRRW